MDKSGYTKTAFLRSLSSKQSEEILRQGTVRDLKPGAVLFRQGDPAVESFLVLEGRLKLGKIHELGKELLIRYIGPGELAAMIAVLEGREYPVSAEAVGTTRVVGWPRTTMVALMTAYRMRDEPHALFLARESQLIAAPVTRKGAEPPRAVRLH